METINHPDLGRVRYEAAVVSDDPDDQVARTVELMHRYAVEDAGSPEIQRDLHMALTAPGAIERASQAFWFVKRRVGFTEDGVLARPLEGLRYPVVEVLIRPRDLSGMCEGGSNCRRIEDCDGFSMYLASLLEADGIPYRFATLAADPRAPGQFSHVYVVAYPDGIRLPLDASHGPRPGWEAPNRYGRLKEWARPGGMGLLLWAGMGLLAAAAFGRTRSA
jgi:transglutaminase-like putative cysteine protease